MPVSIYFQTIESAIMDTQVQIHQTKEKQVQWLNRAKTCKEFKYSIVLTASIRIWTSASGIWWPSLCNPTLSSSMLILPLLLVSMILNPSCMPATSSCDKCSAMTCKFKFQKKAEMVRNDIYHTVEHPKQMQEPDNIIKQKTLRHYLQCTFLKLVHYRELLEPCSHCFT